MSWTAERLDALPEGTVVGWREVGSTAREHFVVRVEHHRYDWFEAGPVGGRYTSNSLLYYAVPSSIRVVSVPIDALLAWEPPAGSVVVDGVPLGLSVEGRKAAVRAAVAHITGEADR